MFDTKRFGGYVARMRKKSRLTQAVLAKKLNLTRQAVSKYEMGDSFPDISILVQIAGIFDITLDELINSGNPAGGETEALQNIPDAGSEGLDISSIVSLNQYLKKNGISQIIKTCRSGLPDGETLKVIAPFLDASSKETILKKIIENESDWRLIEVLLPYMENMAGQLEAAVMDGALPNGVLTIMHEYFLKERIR